jgi:hypothetical protein
MFTGSRQSHVGWSLAAALSLVALVGCGSNASHGGGHISPPTSSDAYASLSWEILDVGGSQVPLTCDSVAGYDFSVSLIDSAGNYYDGAATLACPTDGSTIFQATTFYVPSGYYTIEFYLYGDPTVYGSSNVVIGSYRLTNVHLYPGPNNFAGSPQAVFVESFVVGWALSSNGREAACNPGEIVELQFRRPGSNVWIASDFPCEDYAGTSFPIPVDYRSAEWNIYLLSSTNQELDSIAGGTVSVPNGANIQLPTQAFYVNH